MLVTVPMTALQPTAKVAVLARSLADALSAVYDHLRVSALVSKLHVLYHEEIRLLEITHPATPGPMVTAALKSATKVTRAAPADAVLLS